MEIVPQAEPLQAVPLTLQVTPLLDVPLSVAVNCWWPPGTTVAVGGEMVMPTRGSMVTEAVADFLGSATEVTVTNTCGELGSTVGAV